MRRNFDAACRLAGFTPNNVLECRAPHALLAMAEAGHGVAIIPSALRIHRYRVRVLRVTYRGKPLNEPLTVLSDKRRPLPALRAGVLRDARGACPQGFSFTAPCYCALIPASFTTLPQVSYSDLLNAASSLRRAGRGLQALLARAAP